MSRKLTKINSNNNEVPEKLVRKIETPFSISFSNKLPKSFNFQAMEKKDLKQFQIFLDKVIEMNVTEVDKIYMRPSDKNDYFKDIPVIHYKITDTFRIHGIYLNGRFEVVRIDPNHKYHN